MSALPFTNRNVWNEEPPEEVLDTMSELSDLVHEYNRKSNELFVLKEQIVKLRGTEPPCCFGEDDCSSNALAECPWSMDCGPTSDEHD